MLSGQFSLTCFFFFKQKTAYEMRISDWSSDVCSSDLQFVHIQKINGNNLRLRVFINHDLAPAPRGGTQVDHVPHPFQEAEPLIKLDKLVGRARPIALRPRLVHIGIVQLPLQPTGGGGAATARGLDALLHPIDRHQKMCPSRTIIARNMPSRMPRSATFSSLAGQASNIASNMAQPATTRSARSSPMHALAARSLTDWEDRRSLMSRIAVAGTMQPSTLRRS